MTSPFNPRALMAICSAIVPLDTYKMFGTFRYSFNSFSNCWTRGPLFVRYSLSQIPFRYRRYSSFGGIKGLVTGIMNATHYLILKVSKVPSSQIPDLLYCS